MEKNKKTNDLTEGIIWKQVLLFFIPIVIGSFFQHLYTIIDTIIVGKGLGTDELAGVGGYASKLIILITNFFIGVSSGITAYVSRYFGEKNYEALKHIIWNGLLLFCGVGLLITIIGIKYTNEFLFLMQTPFIVLITTFIIGISSVMMMCVSHYLTKKKDASFQPSSRYILCNLCILVCGFFGIGILINLIHTLYYNEFLFTVQSPLETQVFANIYLKTYLTGILFCVIYNLLTGILRALGDTKRPLYILIFCSFLNIALDLLFTFVFKWGVFGVAFATVIAQGTSAILLGIIVKNSLKNTGVYTPKTDTTAMKEIAKIGIPAGLQSVMFSLSNIAVQSSVNTFQSVFIASWTAYVKLDSIADIFLSSLSSSVIPFVGQNIGANQWKRAKESVWQIMGLSYVIILILIAGFLFNRFTLMSLFTEDIEVIQLGSQLMCIILPMYLLSIPQQIFSQALRGMGNTLAPMYFTLVGVVGFRFFWVYIIFPLHPTLELLALCYPLGALLMSTIFAIYYKIEAKKWDDK